MKTIKAQKLTREAFRPYGDYVQLIRDPKEFEGRKVDFTPDMLRLNLSRFTIASFSICRVEPREMTVAASEYHSYTCGGIIPLDGDVIIHVGKPYRGQLNADQMEAFYVPYGTMVTLNPGVLHMAPYAVNDTVNTIIVLPERTYANDCIVLRHGEDEILTIEK